MTLFLTLILLLGVAIYMYVFYKNSDGFSKTWRPPNGGLGSSGPDSLNPWKLAENAVPRPPWPIDDDGNPIDPDEPPTEETAPRPQ